ncbi:MAG: CarD family transcriptional regulator [Candidatus Gracilibacteria bacterium]
MYITSPHALTTIVHAYCDERSSVILTENESDTLTLFRLGSLLSGGIIKVNNHHHAFTASVFGYHVLLEEKNIPVGSWLHPLERDALCLSCDQEIDILHVSGELVEHGWFYDDTLSRERSYRKLGDTIQLSLRGMDFDVLSISWFDSLIESIVLMKNNVSYVKKSILLPKIPLGDIAETKNMSAIKPKESEIERGYSDLKKALDKNNIQCISHHRDFSTTLKYTKDWNESLHIGRTTSSTADISSLHIESILSLKNTLENENVVILSKYPAKIEKRLTDIGLPIVKGIELPPMARVESHRVGGSMAKIYAQLFQIPSSPTTITILSDDILSPLIIKRRGDREKHANIDLLLQIEDGDYVVHIDHGIGVYEGIEEKTLGNLTREYIRIRYREGNMLYVPATEVYRISKYVGEENPTLNNLGSGDWQRTMERTSEDVEKIARELLALYSERKKIQGFAFPEFEHQEANFREAFKYAYTNDQRQAINDVLSDMAKDEPMDRLLSGDVGFGKTEVAMNAIYRSFLAGKQTALISPLVVLAHEHAISLEERLSPFGIKVGLLTRMVTDQAAKRVIAGLKSGDIHVVVGTHRILSESVEYRDLGLLIIDEEHKFGVMDKEKINQLKTNIDILSLSATPIPRSLNMALSGVKKISLLTTPPRERKPIMTEIHPWDHKHIHTLIEREIERNGQVIVLHNRIATLAMVSKEIQDICVGIKKSSGDPLRITTVHGSMDREELENHIFSFREGKSDVLLSTTVIENGVNFTNANTIIIRDAQDFGLSSLHQLRGRVGRRDREAYCLLTYTKTDLANDAKKRLITLQEHSYLGAGFELALRDLEIRGAGEVLGIKQSGHTRETGIPVFIKMLEEKIVELQTGTKIFNQQTKIELELSILPDESIFSSEGEKIHFYRLAESLGSIEEIEELESEMLYEGEMGGLSNFFKLLKSKIILKDYGVIKLSRIGNHYFFEFPKGTSTEQIRKFLELDPQGNIILLSLEKLRIEARYIGNPESMLGWILSKRP